MFGEERLTSLFSRKANREGINDVDYDEEMEELDAEYRKIAVRDEHLLDVPETLHPEEIGLLDKSFISEYMDNDPAIFLVKIDTDRLVPGEELQEVSDH